MENKQTQAPCTYELRMTITMLDAKETMYISMNYHGKHLMTIVCIIDRFFFKYIDHILRVIFAFRNAL